MSFIFVHYSRYFIQSMILAIAYLVPLGASASLVGIDKVSEEYRIWGTAGHSFGNSPGKETHYDISSSHGPLEFRAEGTDCTSSYCFPAVAESSTGDFSVETFAQLNADARAESRYFFRPNFKSLSIDIDAYNFSTHQEVNMGVDLTDLTDHREIFSQDLRWPKGERYFDEADWNYKVSFDVDPQHDYALKLYAFSSGGDLDETSWLSARPSSVSVPAPASIGVLILGLIALVGVRVRHWTSPSTVDTPAPHGKACSKASR